MDKPQPSGPQTSTIVAPATAAGRSALALIRLSGPAAGAIARELTGRTELPPRRATVVELKDAAGQRLDEAVVTLFAGPASSTGEDVAEVSCHGSPAIVEAVVGRCLELGAEPARPGEFTLRAFLNGRIDLAQAEAVQDLIQSETLYQARCAGQQLRGELSMRLQPLKERMIGIAAQLETAVEFVEDDVSPAGRKELVTALGEVDVELGAMQAGFRSGQLIRHGARVVITGPTNAGKSTIFNSLLNFNRAITSPTPGTTRDVLVEAVDLEGVAATLIDTAGWRDGVGVLEQEGIARTEDEIRVADVVLLVLDGSDEGLPPLGRLGAREERIPVVVALNKRDLEIRLTLPEEQRAEAAAVVEVSGLRAEGMDSLRRELRAAVWPEGSSEIEPGLLTRRRHKQAVDRAREHLGDAASACRRGVSEEFVLYDIRKAFEALAGITGEVTADDVLEAVFSTFCVGK